jgi:hypothetical protein
VSVIVNQSFASRFFPGEDAIGHRLDAMRIPELQNMTVVGIVGDTRRGGTLLGFTPEMYIPYAQFPESSATLVVRSALEEPLTLAADLRSRVAAIDPATAVGTVRRLSDAMARTYGDRRALSWLLTVFASLALGLTILGIASVVSFSVAQRTSEIGIRMALGADAGGVRRLVIRGALGPVAAGAGLGLVALVPLSRVIQQYVFGVSPIDPVSIVLACTILAGAAVGAAWIPARRASGIDPLAALKSS